MAEEEDERAGESAVEGKEKPERLADRESRTGRKTRSMTCDPIDGKEAERRSAADFWLEATAQVEL
jgi:hypothetical protein